MNVFGIGTLNNYSLADQVGEGTYGYVYKAVDRRSGEEVALKRLILHKEAAGFPLFAVREIKFLKSLRHKNIVKLKDVVTSKGCEHKEPPVKHEFTRQDASKQQQTTEAPEEDGYDILKLCGNLYFVFEFVDHDLGGLVDSKYKFTQREIKCIMKQMFEVLDYLQELKIVHRDIKSSNILISNRHHVKLADFGLARSLQGADGREVKLDLSNNVITLWYRPPELLLGAVRYSSSIDIWSTGCVLAELELGRPFFTGKTEAEQFEIICRTLGTPSEEVWPGISALPHFETMIQNAPKFASTMEQSYSGKISEAGMQLLERMLTLDPLKRGTPKVLQGHRYFHTFPFAPNDPSELEPLAIVQGQSFHEYKTKLTRKQKEEENKQQLLQQNDTTSAPSTVNDNHHNNSNPVAPPVPLISPSVPVPVQPLAPPQLPASVAPPSRLPQQPYHHRAPTSSQQRPSQYAPQPHQYYQEIHHSGSSAHYNAPPLPPPPPALPSQVVVTSSYYQDHQQYYASYEPVQNPTSFSSHHQPQQNRKRSYNDHASAGDNGGSRHSDYNRYR